MQHPCHFSLQWCPASSHAFDAIRRCMCLALYIHMRGWPRHDPGLIFFCIWFNKKIYIDLYFQFSYIYIREIPSEIIRRAALFRLYLTRILLYKEWRLLCMCTFLAYSHPFALKCHKPIRTFRREPDQRCCCLPTLIDSSADNHGTSVAEKATYVRVDCDWDSQTYYLTEKIVDADVIWVRSPVARGVCSVKQGRIQIEISMNSAD